MSDNFEKTQEIPRAFVKRAVKDRRLSSIPPSMEGQPVTLLQFSSFVTDFHELAAKFENHDYTMDKLIKAQIQHTNRLEAIDAAITGLREEMEELDSRLDRYVFALLVVIGLVLWMT